MAEECKHSRPADRTTFLIVKVRRGTCAIHRAWVAYPEAPRRSWAALSNVVRSMSVCCSIVSSMRLTAAPIAKLPTDSSPEVQPKAEHRCEQKATVEERNRCYVTRSGRKLTKCLSDHAVEISGTPELSLSFELNKRGQVMDVALSPEELGSTPLGKCVLGVANAIGFGPQDEEIRFRIPLKINQR